MSSDISSGRLFPSAQEYQGWIRDAYGPEQIEDMGSSSLREAYHLFNSRQLGFPTLPALFAEQFVTLREWCYAAHFPGDELLALEDFQGRISRESCKYGYQLYFSPREVVEALDSMVDNCLLLDHSGHGINSHAIHLLMMFGPVRLFLQMGWGGAYLDNEAAATSIQKVFVLVNELLHTLDNYLTLYGILPKHNMYIVGSDLKGGYEFAVGTFGCEVGSAATPTQVLLDAIKWLQTQLDEG